MNKNIYGVQKKPEQEVRSGLDMAVGTGRSAATGAKMGSQVAGPYGAIFGAIAGAAYGFGTQKQGQILEGIQKDSDVARNKFVNNLSGRAAVQQSYSPVQMRKGVKSKKQSKYAIGEIEGDGSGDNQGLGEIHTDKNYNVKNIPNGGKSHEEGGVKVKMEEGDIVFPTQGDKGMYDEVLGLINRYKRGDSNAKVQLEKIRESLPSDSEGEFEDGEKDFKPPLIGPPSRTQMKYMDFNEEFENEEVESKFEPVGFSEEEIEAERKRLEDEILKEQGLNPETLTNEDRELLKVSEGQSIDDRIAELEGEGYSFENREGEDEFGKFTEKVGSKILADDSFEPRLLGGDDEGEEPSYLEAGNEEEYFESPEDDPFYDEAPEEEIIEEPFPSEERIASDDYDYMEIKDRSNPMRYANVLNNLSVGARPASRVTRREYHPEELKYEDRSHSDRAASREKRNYQGQMLRGKGLTAGQQQSYLSQAGSRFLNEQEAINEREMRRADSVDQYNVQNRNQAKLQNIGFHNQYDMFDEQADAAKQAYTDTAMAEISDLSESETRDAYKRDADERAFFIQNKSIPLTNTGEYSYTLDENGNYVWNQPVFTGGSDYTKKVKRNSVKQPKVNKFIVNNGKRK